MRATTKAYGCLLFICIVWGTTYYAIRVGAMQYPPFLFAAVRQLIAGGVLLAIGFFMAGKPDITRKALLGNALIGFLMIAVGNGIVTWGEKVVPSGAAALICSVMPAIAVLLNLVTSKQEKINPLIGTGLLLGVAGVALIFKDNLKDLADPKYLIRISAIFLATTGWAIGSVIGRKQGKATNPTFNAGLQLFFGGAFLMIISLFSESYRGVVWYQPEAFWSLIYLILFGSILAYTAYMFALRTLPVGMVTSYAYVNPLVAVILAWRLHDGLITGWTIASFAGITAGVYLVNAGYQQQKRKAALTATA